MKTEFAKAIEAGEDVVGKEVVLLKQGNYFLLTEGNIYTIVDVTRVPSQRKVRSFRVGGVVLDSAISGNHFEFKHVLDKQKEQELVEFNPFKNQCLAKFLAEADEENKRLKEQLEGALEINKQYEQQLFDLRMENARLERSAQRWEMFNCEANRNIADKLLKKLADEQGE